MAGPGRRRAKRLIAKGGVGGTRRAEARGMNHRTLAPLLFSFATLSGCLDDAELDPELDLDEIEAEVGTPIKPRPACGTSCGFQGELRGMIWAGHDSQPQIASDVGTGKVVRDITYCLVKSAVGSNGQREIMSNKVGRNTWYEQGVATRLGISAATPPSSSTQGSITGWHAVTLSAFGQKLDPDVQWFEIKFPTEIKPSRPSGTWYYDATGRLVPLYYNPTGFYSDANSDFFSGSKPLAGVYPSPTLSLNVAQPVNYGGTNLLGTASMWGNTLPSLYDATYPSWESGSMSMMFGQSTSSSTPSAELHARIPIITTQVMNVDFYADAQVRHYLKISQGPDPDAIATRGEVSVEMGSKTSFVFRVQGKLDLGLFDVDINETIFSWSPIAETKKLGRASFDGRVIRSYVDANGVTSTNPSAWLSSCLASTPAVTSEVPKSDPQQWVNGVKNTIVNNVVGCPNTVAEFAVGRLCDRQGRILPTYPPQPGQVLQ